MLRAISALLLSSVLATAAEPGVEPDAVDQPEDGAAASEEKPAIEDLGGGKFQVGLVTFDQKSRAISFPAEVNMQDGPLEFVIVHRNGKIHESVLITKTRPFHINLALKLLNYQESKELFPILDEDYRPTGKFPEVPDETKNAARAEILLAWKSEDGEKKEATLNDWVTYTATGKSLEPLPWVYGGSYFHENSFQAEASGDIVALFVSNAALFNWPGKDNNLDDVWLPTTKRIPPVGTPVTVTIKPFLKTGKGAAAQPLTIPELLEGSELNPAPEKKGLPLPEPKKPETNKKL